MRLIDLLPGLKFRDLGVQDQPVKVENHCLDHLLPQMVLGHAYMPVITSAAMCATASQNPVYRYPSGTPLPQRGISFPYSTLSG